MELNNNIQSFLNMLEAGMSVDNAEEQISLIRSKGIKGEIKVKARCVLTGEGLALARALAAQK